MDALRPCPDSALLAAFIDGRLGDYERTAVVSHLSECPQCRAVALTVVEFRELSVSDEQWHALVPPASAPRGETRIRRWARAKTRAPALALAAAAILAAIAVPLYFLLSAWSLRHAAPAVVDTVNDQRPIEARVTVERPYAPPPSGQQRPDSSRHLQLVAAAGQIRATNQNDYGVGSRTALGVAALLVGELDDAVGSLMIAAAAAPADGRLASDLAAAYYERSQRGARPDDLPAALGAVERAVDLDSTLAEAWFNRALIITALGMRADARAAWQVYLTKDPSSPWADEARSRLLALTPAAAVTDWTALPRLLFGDSARDVAERAVVTHSGRARDLFENVLFKEWLADAKLGRDTTVAGQRLRVLADAFSTVNQDQFYRDVVTSLETVAASDRRAEFVRAHEEFFAAMALAGANIDAATAAAFERAAAQLAAVASPYASRSRVEAATNAYNRRLYRDAALLLEAEKSAARARGYRALASRAAWILGMAAFGRNDLAEARLEYEEMHASTAENDVDVDVTAHVLLANLHDALGENAEAWRYRIQAASKLEACYLQSTRTNLFLGSAGHALAGGHLAAALLFQTSLLSGPPLNPVSEVQVRVQRASIFFRLGQSNAANNEIGVARARLAAVSRSQIRSNVTADLLTIESEVVQTTDAHRALVLAEKALGHGIDPQDLLRQSRLRMRVAEAAFASGDLDRADRSTAEAIAAIDRFRAAASDQSAVGVSDQATSLYLRASVIALRRGDTARAFDYSERSRIQTVAELRAWGRHSRPLTKIQRQIGADTALAVFTQFGDTLQVWIIRRNDVGTHGVELTGRRAAGLVAAHLDEVSRGIASPGISADLYDALIRPMQRLLTDARHVVVVADAPYNRVAFAGLWDRRSNRYIVEDHRLVIAPSATAYATAMARVRRSAFVANRTNTTLAVTSSVQRTTADDRFLSALASVYSTVRVERADASTPARLLSDMAERDIVHISAMLAPNQQSPLRSRLLMADEPGRRYSGSLSALQLAGVPALRARLVTFDGRGTRRGDLAEGVSGFAAALLAKGVSAVVGPNVQMPMSDLAETWLHFHRHYAAGTPAAESLQRAQLAALGESNRRTGPWATLAVFGSTE